MAATSVLFIKVKSPIMSTPGRHAFLWRLIKYNAALGIGDSKNQFSAIRIDSGWKRNGVALSLKCGTEEDIFPTAASNRYATLLDRNTVDKVNA